MTGDLFGDGDTIPCLSLWQPWASLIALGFKQHETRHWPTRVRGRVAIHASKRVDVPGSPIELCNYAFGAGWTRRMPAGAVVAIGELTGCFRTEDLADTVRWSDERAGNYGPGRYGFRFENVRPLMEPIPTLGRQGFFRWAPPADLEARLGSPVNHMGAASRWTIHASLMGYAR